MGQYYLIVNLDKREVVSPEVFGGGSKLTEFGGGADGAMQALALLTAPNNGDGGGDIYREAWSTQGAIYEPRTGERIHYERQQEYDQHHKLLPPARSCGYRIMVPGCAGRWAGDRIVTAGDYTTANRFMTKAQQLEGLAKALDTRAKYVRSRDNRDPTAEDMEDVSTNIYHYACAFFDDISEIVKEQLILFNTGRGTADDYGNVIREMLANSLLRDFPPIVKTGKKKVIYKWDLTWMAAECIDSFLCRGWYSSKDLIRAKAWMRKQLMLPWQLELLKLYRNGERPVQREVHDLLAAHKVNTTSESPHQQQQLLPSKKYLEAGLALEGVIAGGDMDKTPVSDLTQLAIADAVGVQVRNRMILID